MADEACWFKSSYSGDTGAASCVSIAPLPEQIGICDSKQANGPALLVPTAAWAAFIRALKSAG
ncbi:hypothetical protein VR41_09050 [Streptomyces sp. NRRL B-1568]|nr:hypothetical protein VR41_09050 [Streptomyces sp. NRRL B-1568]